MAFAEGKETDKIRSTVLLSPIAYLSHITTPLGIIGAKAFPGEQNSIHKGKNYCLNASYDLSVLKYEVQSTAAKNLVHLSQSLRGGILSKYDYGSANSNMEHYGESNPPVYDLRKNPHDFPLFLSQGNQDALSDTTDVAILLDSCLNLHDIDKLHVLVQYVEDYAYLDFVMGVI
ncbi:triacylglycerol lipase 2-like [Olea europaea subsp. europaea]|uniref:Triacylglycerol lipase 2-like n=1 Tax=Olea europaea subsp. europaea TaxID=158383 RepID=A0A8S0PKC4_OLEEU|nr:triacylglycerol lipase 2-like [Olea europaea subsp. europaea]